LAPGRSGDDEVGWPLTGTRGHGGCLVVWLAPIIAKPPKISIIIDRILDENGRHAHPNHFPSPCQNDGATPLSGRRLGHCWNLQRLLLKERFSHAYPISGAIYIGMDKIYFCAQVYWIFSHPGGIRPVSEHPSEINSSACLFPVAIGYFPSAFRRFGTQVSVTSQTTPMAIIAIIYRYIRLIDSIQYNVLIVSRRHIRSAEYLLHVGVRIQVLCVAVRYFISFSRRSIFQAIYAKYHKQTKTHLKIGLYKIYVTNYYME